MKKIKAVVIRSGAKSVLCKINDSNLQVDALLLGKFYKKKNNAVVGDHVLLSIEEDKYLIQDILPRRNEITRIIVRERKKRTIASNCDYLVITVSVSKPRFKRGIIDRFLLRSIQWGIPAIVIFNKMDEWNDSSTVDLKFEENRIRKLGVLCFEISALKKDSYKNRVLDNDLTQLRKILKSKTVIFLGQSGVGKSHLISSIADEDHLLLSREISNDGKGKHTTTWCEKIDLKDFSFIDSPGIRSFAIDDLIKDEFIQYWPDIEELGFKCKFKDCLHKKGTKGCNLQINFLDNKIVMSRLESFHDMYHEVADSEFWEKKYN